MFSKWLNHTWHVLIADAYRELCTCCYRLWEHDGLFVRQELESVEQMTDTMLYVVY
jgi:hypothetical protein